MSAPPSCPRCGGALRAPSPWSSSWQCERHGPVEPYHLLRRASGEASRWLCGISRVPVWLPVPLPTGWTVTGLGWAGDERSGGRAAAVACTGPAPLGGPADLVLLAEEPGVGLGARYAGLPGPDPGPPEGAPEATVSAGKHETPLWSVPAPRDRVAYVGEAKGLWLWLVLWPEPAGLVLAEHMLLADLREGDLHDLLLFGAPSTRLDSPA